MRRERLIRPTVLAPFVGLIRRDKRRIRHRSTYCRMRRERLIRPTVLAPFVGLIRRGKRRIRHRSTYCRMRRERLIRPTVLAPVVGLIRRGKRRIRHDAPIAYVFYSCGHNHAAPRTPLESPCFALRTGVSHSPPKTNCLINCPTV